MWIMQILCADILKGRCDPPHKFRHGHAVYALKMAKDVSALKAVSQNLMHQNLEVYVILSETDVRKQIAELGQKIGSSNAGNVEELVQLAKALLEKLGQS